MGESAFRDVLFHYTYNTVFIIGHFRTTEVINFCVVDLQEFKVVFSLPSDGDEMCYLMKDSSEEYDDSNYVFISKDDNDRTFILKRVRGNIFRDIKTDLNTNVLKFCIDALSEAERADEAVMDENWEKLAIEWAHDNEPQSTSSNTENNQSKHDNVYEKRGSKCSGKQISNHLRKKQRRKRKIWPSMKNCYRITRFRRKR